LKLSLQNSKQIILREDEMQNWIVLM